FSSRRRHTRFSRDWSSDVCSSDLDVVGIDLLDEIRVGQHVGVAAARRTLEQVEQGDQQQPDDYPQGQVLAEIVHVEAPLLGYGHGRPSAPGATPPHGLVLGPAYAKKVLNVLTRHRPACGNST